MVYSNINSTVFYKEEGIIDTEDIGYESTLFEMEIYGKKTVVVFGKLKYTFIQRNIVYVPIYLVVYNKVKTQIGILEFTKYEVVDILDDDNDIIIDNIKAPITFGFFDESFVDRSGSDSKSSLKTDDYEEVDINDDIVDLSTKDDEDDTLSLIHI